MRSPAATNGPRDDESTRGPDRPAQLSETVYRAQRYMRREGPGHTLQTTALVNEAFLRLAAHQEVAARGETDAKAMFARAMQRILVDHARRKLARKRGGERVRVALDGLAPAAAEHDLLDLQEVLQRLAQVDPQQCQLVELRVFGGMTVAEAANALGVSKRTAEREWTAARAWLRRELAALAPHDS